MEYKTIRRDWLLLSNNIINLPINSCSYNLANKVKDIYLASQTEMTRVFKNGLLFKIIYTCFQTILLSICLIERFHEKVFKILDKRINLRSKGYESLKIYELNFITLFVLLWFIVKPIISNISFQNAIYVLILLFIFYIILPYLIIGFYRIFSRYKIKLTIFICVVAILLILFQYFMTNLIVIIIKTMTRQLDLSNFSESFKECARKLGYEKKIYIVNEKEKFNNAGVLLTLTGESIILIIGSIEKMKKLEIESILFHEFGHVIDNTKIIYYMLIAANQIWKAISFIFIYKLSKKFFRCKNMSHFTTFMILFTVFNTFFDPWMHFISNAYYQSREINADKFVYNYKRHLNLADALFNVACNKDGVLYYSKLWGLFYQTHPSLYSRIEFLSNL
ncbi:CAAX prenyl protease 1 [Astathelohania contejeani]|uniref:CAAX prenyl protease 1 n=1 Tax=Astathelohania contejeani TaxID=164912 RepID=A0ABQ7HY52_9MICR|nr:CAAX prenyl protease 1 [Thelohania contejeani]